MKRLFTILVGALLAAGLLASCDDDKPSEPVHEHIPLSEGTWRIVTSGEVTAGDPEDCNQFTGTFVDTVQVDDDGHVDDDFFSECDFDADGNDFTFACTFAEPIAGTCVFHIAVDGEGTVDGNTFAAGYDVVTSGQGDCSAFPIPPCTIHFTVTGTKLVAAPAGLPLSGPRRALIGGIGKFFQRGGLRVSE